MGTIFRTYKKKLNTLLFLGIIIAIPFGYLAPEMTEIPVALGELFLRSLFLLIVPVIVVSMMSGILQFEDSAQLGSIGIRTLASYC